MSFERAVGRVQLEELREDQVSIIKRNKWLEANRVEMSRRLAGSQDAQATLRAAADKALAYAAAAAEEALAAHDAQLRDGRTLVDLINEVQPAQCMMQMHSLSDVTLTHSSGGEMSQAWGTHRGSGRQGLR